MSVRLEIQQKHIDFMRQSHISLAHDWDLVPSSILGKVITLGSNVSLEPYVRFTGRQNINFFTMGAFSYCIGLSLAGLVECGRYCSIGRGVQVMGDSHPIDRMTTSPFTYAPRFKHVAQVDFNKSEFIQIPFYNKYGEVKICNDVWIGDGALLKGGIEVGTGAVIAANSVVVKDVPPYAIVGGNPAKVIRSRFDDLTVASLLESR